MRWLVRVAAGRNAIFHIAVLVLCGVALWRGIQTTSDLNWPGDPDHLRDISHAQTIQDGNLFADPSYLGEKFWYNPLVPALLAGLSSLLDIPIHVVHARGAAYLNLAAPLTFYAMGVSLLGAPASLAALCAFLFLPREPSWFTATYSPWLFTANFVQSLFYVTIVACLRAYQTRERRWHVFTGVLLGLTFLGHTAPAILIGAILVLVTLYRLTTDPEDRSRPLIDLVLTLATAAVVATPLLISIVGHYQLRIKNPVPTTWLDPSMYIDQWRTFLAATLQRPLINTFIVVAALALLLRHPEQKGARLVITAWLAAALALFLTTAYGPQISDRAQIRFPQVVPAHHFLLYVRAGEGMLFGHGLWVAATFMAGLAGRARRGGQGWSDATKVRVALTLVLITVAGLVLSSLSRQKERMDYSALRESALRVYADSESRQVWRWMRQHTGPNAVFLTAENSGLSMVTTAGRKAIAVPTFFSNPYVSYERRNQARRQMWRSLEEGQCREFHTFAAAYRLSHVLAIQGATPVPQPGDCGLEHAFTAGAFTVWRVAGATQ